MPHIRTPCDLVLPVDASDHTQGAADAAVTLVWYGDYECPSCGRAFAEVRAVQRAAGNSLRLAYRHFPTATVHSRTSAIALAAEAAAAQGKFWPMHDLLFARQDDLADADLLHYALQAGVEIYRFAADLAAERYEAKVRRDRDSGLRSGVAGAPAFFVNGLRYNGPATRHALLAAVRDAAVARRARCGPVRPGVARAHRVAPLSDSCGPASVPPADGHRREHGRRHSGSIEEVAQPRVERQARAPVNRGAAPPDHMNHGRLRLPTLAGVKSRSVAGHCSQVDNADSREGGRTLPP